MLFVVRLHPDAKVVVLGEKAEQFAPCEVDVVVLAPGYEGDVDPTASGTIVAHGVFLRPLSSPRVSGSRRRLSDSRR